jgi:hypothetical protein
MKSHVFIVPAAVLATATAVAILAAQVTNRRRRSIAKLLVGVQL